MPLASAAASPDDPTAAARTGGRAAATGPEDLRVLVFCEHGHPAGTFLSGVTRFTRNLFRFAEERGLELDVVTYHGTAGTVERGSVRYHGVPPRTPVTFHGLEVDPWDIVPVRNRRLLEPALAGARQRPYDLVFSTAPGVGTQAALAAGALGLPLVLLFTTDLPNYGAEHLEARFPRLARVPWLKKAARAAAWRYLAWLYDRRRTDLVLVPTAAVRDLLVAHAEVDVGLLGRGSDTLEFAEPADLAGHEAPPTLLFVGRLDIGQKNLDVLCRTIREIEGARLVFAGDGEDRGKLEAALEDLVADGRVRFTGHVADPEELAEVYRSADVFVFPSVYDTLGQVVVEAQKAGLPVVVMDAGGPPELVLRDRSGFVARDADAFVDACRRLVEDRALRLRMGGEARRHALSLPTWDDVMERLFGYFGEVVASRRG